MSEKRWAEVDSYLDRLLVGDDAVLEAARAAGLEAGLPDIAVSPSQGKLLYLLARMQKAARILEIGTLAGYSTLWMARALPADGRLITLEADATHAAVARANFKAAGYADRIELKLGRAIETLPKLASEAPFDLVFIDADKASMPEYFQWALTLSRPGAALIFDNVVRDGRVIHAKSSDPNILGVRRLNEMLAAEKRVSATCIQTVGGKGYDGFTLAIVEG
ncbi:O-methyltransferase [Silvibacterium dinghuense]|uniref:O-methyltransferase n=1 Tax=Silvibacterium dinghuense TaxID=1560006 RepID=A0A4Q1SCT2_9BACT|nr:O-methyltransferase [Silvibacterium dinghuense]RXS95014.1 O-methyltransferase [Silvibacterium dinghuense]GGH09885.1 O-methyltransferase [Silvibacterium dinghuense]